LRTPRFVAKLVYESCLPLPLPLPLRCRCRTLPLPLSLPPPIAWLLRSFYFSCGLICFADSAKNQFDTDAVKTRHRGPKQPL